ncbi:DUF4913 domain-containing protein [Phytomonospora sp. NPDC050363]|uniref:DUF4913 domain-containing protein n=1 Tax=Phytomonospora sp. NPDC050363 TaxID=3155642 RepID=UPI0033ED5A80
MTDPTEGSAAELAEVVAEQLHTIRDLRRELDRLRERYGVLDVRVHRLESAAKSPGRGGPIDWTRLDGAERARVLAELAGFVGGLVEGERLHDAVAPCWWRHAAAVEELGALWQAREYAYGPGREADLPCWWREVLDRAIPRLRVLFAPCAEGHTEPAPSRSEVDDAGLAAHLAELRAEAG